jgi:uncharacterized protein
MLELIKQPWHWAVAGVCIGLTVPTLLLIGNKNFGLSSSLRHICAMCIPANIPYLKYNWKAEIWNVYFVVGVVIGGMIAAQLLSNPDDVVVAATTQSQLSQMGIKDFTHLMPSDLFTIDHIFTLKGLIFFVLGGFLVGFGTRYADGCTSGHSILGIANLQWPSLIATICFMIGGFFSANILIPLIFALVK